MPTRAALRDRKAVVGAAQRRQAVASAGLGTRGIAMTVAGVGGEGPARTRPVRIDGTARVDADRAAQRNAAARTRACSGHARAATPECLGERARHPPGRL